jgi:hypothetical protein
MAARKRPPTPAPELVRKAILVDQAKLDRARKFLNAPSDAAVLRMALDHLLSHFEEPPSEEE